MNSPLVKLGVAVVTLLCVGGVFVFFGSPIGYNNGYAPEQPIPYDHSLHAGYYKIPCEFCHYNAEKSRHATVPTTDVCMKCHKQVKTDSPVIQQITKMFERGESISWVRVNLLPEHVKFNHKRHIAKGVQCQTCHGAVEQMQVYYQKEAFNMGWCIECHKKPENQAPISCDTCHY